MVAGLAVFLLIERGVTPRYALATSMDARIPFIAWSWLVYVSFFPLVVALSAHARALAFAAFKEAAVTAFVIGIVCFLLFPENVPRPNLAAIDSAFVRHRLAWMWWFDLAANGFPSLHVAVTCLACWMLPAHRYRTIAALACLLICVSTLTLKQHTLADVLGGVLLALLCALWAGRHRIRRQPA
jgi:membrane-associated phospholipid phosphatase